MGKVITKRVSDSLDSFISQNQKETQFKSGETINQNKRTLKKNDGLIERVGDKIYITEDNRQLLND